MIMSDMSDIVLVFYTVEDGVCVRGNCILVRQDKYLSRSSRI